MATLNTTTENALGFALKPGGAAGSYIVKGDYVAIQDNDSLKDVKTYIDTKISESVANASIEGGFVLKGALPTTMQELLHSISNVCKHQTSTPCYIDDFLSYNQEMPCSELQQSENIGKRAYVVGKATNGCLLISGILTPSGVYGNAATTKIEHKEDAGSGPLMNFYNSSSTTAVMNAVGWAYVADRPILANTSGYKENLEAGDIFIITSDFFTGVAADYTIVQNNIVGAITESTLSNFVQHLTTAEIDEAILK